MTLSAFVHPCASLLPRSLAHPGFPSTWGLGRHPLHSVPKVVLGQQARRTVLSRPPQYALGEDR